MKPLLTQCRSCIHGRIHTHVRMHTHNFWYFSPSQCTLLLILHCCNGEFIPCLFNFKYIRICRYPGSQNIYLSFIHYFHSSCLHINSNEPGQLSRYTNQDTGWMTDESRFDSWQVRDIFSSPQPASWPTKPSIQWPQGPHSLGVKRLACKADNSIQCQG